MRPSRTSSKAETDLGLAPRPDISAQIRFRRWYRAARIAIIFSLIFTPLAILVIVGNASSATSDRQPRGRAIAEVALAAWLTGTDSFVASTRSGPMPGADVETWLSATVSDPARDGAVTEIHQFLISTTTGPLIASVELVVNAAGDIEVIDSAPAILPVTVAQPTPRLTSWQGTKNATVPAPVTDAVQRWARLFFTGDSAELYRLTGDTDATRIYPGLPTLGAVESVSIAEGAIRSDGSLIVRARVTTRIAPDVEPTRADFDLLVADADLPVPKIVAWGGPGTGPNLKSFENAVPAFGTQIAPTVPTTTVTSTIAAPATTSASTTVPALIVAPPTETTIATTTPAPVDTVPADEVLA